MESDAVGWTTLVVSGRVTDKACRVWGFIIKTGSTGEAVTVYDGQDIGSGRLFSTYYVSVKGSQAITFSKPVHFDSGVYVDFVGNIDEVTVLWEPAEG